MEIKDKLANALLVNKRVIEYFFTKNSGVRKGAAYITVLLNGSVVKKKIYYNQRPPVAHHHKLKEHVSAIILSISSKTQISVINQKINAELDIYESGLWAEAEAGRILQLLKEEELIQDYKPTEELVDVLDSYDYTVIKKDNSELRIDITSSKTTKGWGKIEILKKKGVHVLSVNKNIPPNIQKKLFLKLLNAG